MIEGFLALEAWGSVVEADERDADVFQGRADEIEGILTPSTLTPTWIRMPCPTRNIKTILAPSISMNF